MWTLLNLSCKCLIPQLKLFVEGMTPFEYRRLNSNQSLVRHEIEINYLTPLILNKKDPISELINFAKNKHKIYLLI